MVGEQGCETRSLLWTSQGRMRRAHQRRRSGIRGARGDYGLARRSGKRLLRGIWRLERWSPVMTYYPSPDLSIYVLKPPGRYHRKGESP